MSIIYEPAGKAREYSPLACNLYSGCNHGCRYCYAPNMRRMKREDYRQVIQRKNIVAEFEKETRALYRSDRQVLFNFMTDPYNSEERSVGLTRACLEICLRKKIPVAILTKSPTVLDDLELFKKFGPNIQVGFTLTFDNEKDSREWEPEAATPDERIAMLKMLKENGIKTWASFEPVISPEQSLEMIRRSLPFVDVYKVGKLNNFEGRDKLIDWPAFLSSAVSVLRPEAKPFYVKYDLRGACPAIDLRPEEKDADLYALKNQF